MDMRNMLLSAAVLAYAGLANAGVTPDEARQLGTTLTLVGAEKAGNKDGTIPPYTGGVTTPPKDYQKGNGIRPDPFASEKPLFSIDAKNMGNYADRLSEGTKALMKKYPSYRVDVYPPHRSVAFPKSVTDNTLKCATTAKTSSGGLSMEGCKAGVPFPIPRSGFEAMWNHLTRFVGTEGGRAVKYGYKAYYVDAAGTPTMTTKGTFISDYPYWDTNNDSDLFSRVSAYYHEPARRSGEATLLHDALNAAVKSRRAWIYLPGQRRTKLAPSVSFDTPNTSMGGGSTYDDSFLFYGSMERYNFKLVGKKEIYVPYNTYKLSYHSKTEDLLKPNHFNPDLVRWELHRVWLVEATLGEGKRHIYSKRLFYLDEDSWITLLSDEYDMRGQLYRVGQAFLAPSYEVPAPMADTYGLYDLISGVYAINLWTAETGGIRYVDPLPERQWVPDALAGGGLR